MSRTRLIRRALTSSLVLAAALGATGAHAEVVDVELVLAVDVSLSMSPSELAIQRDGYVAALTHDEVIQAIQDGVHGKIAITYVEWAGVGVQEIIVPWTIVAGPEDARRVADRLTAHPPASARRTSISGALDYVGDMFAESPHRGMKRVVDVSGDGPNNQGGPVMASRDALVEQGITVNGLPLMTSGGFASVYDVEDLDAYYANCVIGGPGSFMIPVNDWSQFPEAVRRKLVLELAETPYPQPQAPLPVVLASTAPGYDCEIGERMWRDRMWMWDSR